MLSSGVRGTAHAWVVVGRSGHRHGRGCGPTAAAWTRLVVRCDGVTRACALAASLDAPPLTCHTADQSPARACRDQWPCAAAAVSHYCVTRISFSSVTFYELNVIRSESKMLIFLLASTAVTKYRESIFGNAISINETMMKVLKLL